MGGAQTLEAWLGKTWNATVPSMQGKRLSLGQALLWVEGPAAASVLAAGFIESEGPELESASAEQPVSAWTDGESTVCANAAGTSMIRLASHQDLAIFGTQWVEMILPPGVDIPTPEIQVTWQPAPFAYGYFTGGQAVAATSHAGVPEQILEPLSVEQRPLKDPLPCHLRISLPGASWGIRLDVLPAVLQAAARRRPEWQQRVQRLQTALQDIPGWQPQRARLRPVRGAWGGWQTYQQQWIASRAAEAFVLLAPESGVDVSGALSVDALMRRINTNVARAIEGNALHPQSVPAPEPVGGENWLLLLEGTIEDRPVAIGWALGEMETWSALLEKRQAFATNGGFARAARVPLQLRAILGNSRMSYHRIKQLRAGDVIALDQIKDDPLRVAVNGQEVARGITVEIARKEGSWFGIRITDVGLRRNRG